MEQVCSTFAVTVVVAALGLAGCGNKSSTSSTGAGGNNGTSGAGGGGAGSGNGGGAGSGNHGGSPSQMPDPQHRILEVTLIGPGTVSSTPSGIACAPTCAASFATGASVTLSATPSTGYTFAGWMGAGCSGTSTCTVTLNDNQTVSAKFAPEPTAGTAYVPLDLVASPTATRVPIRTGVPFPSGAVPSVDRLRLELGDGSAEVPAQIDALASWPDGSVKVALVQLVGDLGAAAKYRVAYGPDVKRAAVPRSVSVAEAGGTATVDTGFVKATIDAKGVLSELWRDTNNDGQYGTTERLVTGGDIFLDSALDSTKYTASAAAAATLSVEEKGPIRAVIKAFGTLGASGKTSMKYLARYYFSAGSDVVDVELTLIDDRLDSDVANPSTTLPIAASGLGMKWQYASASPANYRFGGESAGVHGGAVGGSEHYLLQTGTFDYVDGVFNGSTFAYSGAGTGKKAPGWLTVDGSAASLSLMVRDFWQQFPSELSVDGTTLSANLFPARSISGAPDTKVIAPSGTRYRRPNTFYFLHPGGAKTYQLRLAAHASAPDTKVLHALNDGYQQHKLLLRATAQWYTASGVWGDLAVGGPGSPSAGWDDVLLNSIYIPSFERTSNFVAQVYGWRDFGDRLREGWADVQNGLKLPSFFDDTHIGSNRFFQQFLRTGEDRWFNLGETATRHFMDIDVAHGPRQGYWETGNAPQPAGEFKGSAHDNIDHEQSNMHWGHAQVSGLSELYLLTGDKRSLDVLREIAGWWKFVRPHFFPLPFDNARDYREAERDFAWPLYVMNEYVRVTGDDAYHREVSAQLVKYLIQWWQTPLDHIGYDPASGVISDRVLGKNDASKGTGYWTMSLMDNNDGTKATGTNPWMAGPLVSSLIKFYEQDKQFAVAGKGATDVPYAVLIDMLLQCQNYIVKYGYDDKLKDFVYSEVMRDSPGDDTIILYGVAYLDRLMAQELAAGRLAHPEWYDTRSRWAAIASGRYDELRTIKPDDFGTQTYGFYGYELVHPADFFKIMRDTLGR